MIEEYKRLINSEKFKSWRNKNKDSYLSSVFFLKDNERSSGLQFDYYLPKKKRMTTFIVDNNIKVTKDQKIFTTSDKIDEIDLKDIKFSFDNVVKLVMPKYRDKRFVKEIIIVQSLNSKLLWNVSLVTSDFNLINIKIDAVNGKIIEETSSSLLQFKASYFLFFYHLLLNALFYLIYNQSPLLKSLIL